MGEAELALSDITLDYAFLIYSLILDFGGVQENKTKICCILSFYQALWPTQCNKEILHNVYFQLHNYLKIKTTSAVETEISDKMHTYCRHPFNTS